ncbi:putative ANTH domain-containing protein [Dioscorea sansibarensis]
MHEIVTILTDSPATSHNFVLGFTRRFGRARSARVTTKCLMLLHRLLRALPTPHPFRSDLLYARANGFISLNPCNFSCASYDLTVFVHAYPRLLDHATLTAGQPNSPTNYIERIKEAERALELVPQVQDLLDLVMECEPTGTAPLNYVTRLAMEQIARESFGCYAAVRREIPVMLDNLLCMRHHSCVAGLAVYRRAADQGRRLSKFYEWCRHMRLCVVNEYPLVERIPRIQVRALESLVEGLWQLTESEKSSSSSSSYSSLSKLSLPSSMSPGMSTKTNDVEVDEKLLIRLEGEEEGWDELLEASLEDPGNEWSLSNAWKQSTDGEGTAREGWMELGGL